MDQALIERIVANVLQQLQPVAAPRAEVAPSTEVLLDGPVITAELLADRVEAGQTLRIGPRAILTPTARDWLQQRKIRWKRSHRSTNGKEHAATRRQLLINTITPAIRTLRESLPRELPGWKHELLGTAAEVADIATRAINAAEAEIVVAISDAADVVACRANRNSRVRAAVVASPEHMRLLVEHLGPNVLVINPRGRSFVELRNLLRAMSELPAPQPPKNWT